MNNLKAFGNPEFGTIRVSVINSEPWFVGKDVAEILGYQRTADAIRTHVDSEDKGVGEIQTPGGTQTMTVINESGLYSLILSSKLPTAKKFKRWVASEVLPAIRKHGAYLTEQKGASYNMPTQRAMDMGLFRVKEGTYINGSGANIVTKTTKVTGRGQQFFINKFLKEGA